MALQASSAIDIQKGHILIFTQRSMVIAHATGDGRGIFQLMELFLDYLLDALNVDEDVSEGSVWGNEITRLTPPAAFVSSLVTTGRLPDISRVPTHCPSNRKELWT